MSLVTSLEEVVVVVVVVDKLLLLLILAVVFVIALVEGLLLRDDFASLSSDIGTGDGVLRHSFMKLP